MNQFLHFIILSSSVLNVFGSSKRERERYKNIEILKNFLESNDYKPVTVLLSSKNPLSVPVETIKQSTSESEIDESEQEETIEHETEELDTPYVEYENVYKAVMSELCTLKSPSALNSPLCDKSVLDGKNEFNVNNPEIKFLDNNFLMNLNNLLTEPISNYSSRFEDNLYSLIIKWLLIKRQEYPDDQEGPIGKFEKLFENAEAIGKNKFLYLVTILEPAFQIFISFQTIQIKI